MIFFVGPHGAGKTHSGLLLEKNNFKLIDTGPILRQLHKDSGHQGKFGDWIREGEVAHGPAFTDNLLVKEIEGIMRDAESHDPTPTDFILVGNRSLGGIQYIVDNVGSYRENRNSIVYINAPFEILFDRYVKREGHPMSEDEFRDLLDRDRKMGLEELRLVADRQITNDGSEDLLDGQLRSVIKELQYPELRLSQEIKEGKNR